MLVNCRKCFGRGRIFTGGVGIATQCPICKGKGKLEIPEGKKICPKCEGRKKIPTAIGMGFTMDSYCDYCFGDGYVDKK